MGIQYWADDVLIVDLPPEPEMGEVLDDVLEVLYEKDSCAVLIDFSEVDIVSSSSLSKMLALRRQIWGSRYRIVFCCVDPATEGILVAAGIDECFELADDRFSALTTIEMAG